ncbi:MAG: TIGR04372 family glycosyltransferase, partial [Candidatus Eremiobacterota bacterium]
SVYLQEVFMELYQYINKLFDYINSRSPVLIITPMVEYIGNAAEEIYYALLKARREGKKVLLLYPYNLIPRKTFKFVISNYELFNLESDYSITDNSYLSYLLKLFLTIFYNPMRFYYCLRKALLLRIQGRKTFREKSDSENTSNYWYKMPSIGRTGLFKPEKVRFFSWDVVKELKWGEQFNEPLSVRLNRNKRIYAEDMRVKMGIPADKWFVCLHVREQSFYQDNDRPWRNSSIFNYIKGIKAIVDSGGYVVRMGDKSMTPMPKMRGVIDYPFSPFKSELMDLYLISECRFYIGTNSGPFGVANLFQKPMIMVNLSDLAILSYQKVSFAIIKHLYSHSRNRFLSISEILQEPFECQGNKRLGSDYIMFENTPDEIYDVITEFLNRLTDWEYTGKWEYSELQKEFMYAKRLLMTKWVNDGIVYDNSPFDVVQTYRFASYIDSDMGTLYHKYLEQNWSEDSMNHYYSFTE